MGGGAICRPPCGAFGDAFWVGWNPDSRRNRTLQNGGFILTKIYTFVNQKGGVGKTTTTINVAAYLAKMGQRALVVDLDPQANATSCLGVDKLTVENSTYEALLGNEDIFPYILLNERLNLSLLPSAPALAGAEVELVDELARESRLRKALLKVANRFDYILIDCPPSLGLLTVNGLMAAMDGVIVPVQCEYLALEGLGQLTETIERVRSALFPELRVRGVVLTMFDNRTNLSADVVREVNKHFPNLVFKSVIPRNIRLAEAPSYGLPISEYAPHSPGAEAYTTLAKELLKGDKN
ncbi:ParA family protein [Chloroflexi bacterium CFX5]|nr:ParA family protein [Chloroflexi bacterium CFX5]